MKHLKAISPVVSVLLLVIIAATAAVMLYVWFSGYFASASQRAGALETITIVGANAQFTKYTTSDEESYYGTAVLTITVQNLANEAVQIKRSGITVIINGLKLQDISLTPSTVTISPGSSASFVVNATIDNIKIDHGNRADITIIVSATGQNTGATYSDTYQFAVTAP